MLCIAKALMTEKKGNIPSLPTSTFFYFQVKWAEDSSFRIHLSRTQQNFIETFPRRWMRKITWPEISINFWVTQFCWDHWIKIGMSEDIHSLLFAVEYGVMKSLWLCIQVFQNALLKVNTDFYSKKAINLINQAEKNTD